LEEVIARKLSIPLKKDVSRFPVVNKSVPVIIPGVRVVNLISHRSFEPLFLLDTERQLLKMAGSIPGCYPSLNVTWCSI